jgi:hypothetical protein
MRCQHLESYLEERKDSTQVSEFAVNMRPGNGMCFEEMAKCYVGHGGGQSTGLNISRCKEDIGSGCQDR